MDPRIPELHQAALRMLVARAVGLEDACAILTAAPSERLTADAVKQALACLEAESPSPLRATLFDLARLISGVLPTDDVIVPPRAKMKVFLPAS